MINKMAQLRVRSAQSTRGAVRIALRVAGATAIVLCAAHGIASAQQTTPATQAEPTAQVSPSPAPAPKNVLPSSFVNPYPFAMTKAGPLSFGAKFRAYDFIRINASQNAGNPNRQAFLPGALLHVSLSPPGLAVPIEFAATYVGAYNFGLDGVHPERRGVVDNTLPGFNLSSFGEAYVKVRLPRFTAALGNQFLNLPWLPSADSRIKPVAFQGANIAYLAAPNLTLGVWRETAFEGRTSSAFNRNTLITSSAAGANANPAHDTSGVLVGGFSYTNGSNVSVNGYYYDWYDIARAAYADAKFTLAKANAPYVAVQYFTEGSTGRAVAGRIANDTYGFQIGATPLRGLSASVGVDVVPARIAFVNATSAARATAGLWVPIGGTPSAVAAGAGRYLVSYGGIASPYTESYAADPLYTTSITAGAVDRRSSGNSIKGTLTYRALDQRLVAIVSQAYYDYSNFAGANTNAETGYDVTYFFNKVGKGPYRGLSLRERYADRKQPQLPYDFKYVRMQLEYSL